MKLKSLNELGEFLKTAEASVAEASVKEFLKDALKEEADKYSKEIEALTNDKTSFANQLETISNELKEIKDKYQATAKELQEQKDQALFNSRMDEVDSKFDLSDEQRKAVASQIKGLDDTGYTGWLTNFSLFGKPKQAQASAAVETDLSKSLENVQPSVATTPPNAASPQEDEFAQIEKNLTTLFN